MWLMKKISDVTALPCLVQVPEARGKVIPEIASMSDDLPALWDPRTAMTGMSRSRCALREEMEELRRVAEGKNEGDSYPVARRRFTESSILRFWPTYCGSERPTGASFSSGKAWVVVSMNEDCLAVSDPRTTLLDMSVYGRL